jgi:hypothetical protein
MVPNAVGPLSREQKPCRSVGSHRVQVPERGGVTVSRTAVDLGS